MCCVLNVSEAGYYKYIKNLDKPDKDTVLSAAIMEIIGEVSFNDNYGVPRMKIALFNKGLKVGTRRLTRLMRELNLIHERKRRPKGLTKATTEVQEQENLIKQDFTADRPFTKLLTDISQIQCEDGKLYISPILDADGKLYISPILDCFGGEILALQMRNNMKKELCIDTIEAAARRYPIRGAILHSDRGSQYTSDEFRKTLKSNGVTQSLSGVDHCYDNARMESFFATLKKELLYRIPTHTMRRSKVETIIFRYVFTYYNTIRINTSNPGGLPPAAYRIMQPEEALAA